MHSLIYQISTKAVNADDLLDTDNITEGEGVSFGYIYESGDEHRNNDIIDLVESCLPTGMFSINDDLTLTFNGGAEQWRSSYLARVKEAAESMTEANIMDYAGPVYNIQKAILNPLNTDLLFVMDFGAGMGIAEQSREFMRFVMMLKAGDTIHIGSILGYHR